MFFRLRDIFISVLLLILFSWLFLLIVLVLLIAQGKVFFVQERTGKNMKPFRLIKFSTLRDAAPGEDEFASQRARLTPAGKILRRLSLDEFPQLLNVIAGNMSLVGPRPLLPDYDTLYSEEEKKRFLELPGITGWAQIHGRNKLPFKERFKLDVWYVEHKSLMLDMRIMLKSAALIFKSGDVYTDDHTTAYKWDGN